MNKVQRRGVWLGPFLLFVATLTAATALLGTTTTFAHAKPLPLRITTMSLPNGCVCASYTAFITANKGGGSSLDTWKLVSGALPAGLTMATSYGIQLVNWVKSALILR